MLSNVVSFPCHFYIGDIVLPPMPIVLLGAFLNFLFLTSSLTTMLLSSITLAAMSLLVAFISIVIVSGI